MPEWIEYVLNNWEPWLGAIMAVMIAAKAIVALTPTPRDDEWLGKIYHVLEIISLTLGKAKQMPPNKK
jgi:hypothetical protein